MRIRIFIFIAGLWSGFALPARAAALPQQTLETAVYIVCEDRQGSGAVVNAEQGYVLTVGHVILGAEGAAAPAECTIGFIQGGDLTPKSFYRATVERAVLDFNKDLDFGVLKIHERLSGPPVAFSELLAYEFAQLGEEITALGYPSGGPLAASVGKITSYNRGMGQTDAAILKGSSGSPVIDAAGRISGVAARQRLSIDQKTGAETVAAYEFGDVIALINWLETFGPGTHDRYLKHADYQRFHAPAYVVREEGLGCTHLVRTELSPTVYCLMADQKRLVFPNVATYDSWYRDFSEVLLASLEDIAKYKLAGNITFKAGTLVKIATDPKVYAVTDSIGTLRWVQTEARAAQLFGPDWAQKVRDVPDSFFVNYTVGEPIS